MMRVISASVITSVVTIIATTTPVDSSLSDLSSRE